MYSIAEATDILQKAYPDRRIEPPVVYNGSYLFQAFDDNDELEGSIDPFFTVNRDSGEVSEFSILTDGNMAEIAALYANRRT